MNVLLYRVGRNLNRAYRTAEAFGVDKILLLECDNAFLQGNLFKAKKRVTIEKIDSWPSRQGLLALETFYETSIYRVCWPLIDTIAIGGETDGLPRSLDASYKAYIPMCGEVSGLTVEAALAIALYEWRRVGRF